MTARRTRRLLHLMTAVVAIPLVFACGSLAAQVPKAEPAQTASPAWPSRPVRFVVPFGPGSGTDIVARLVGQKLSEAIGQPVVVENKPGASGAIAASAAARAAPDGHTVFIGTQTTQASNLGMFRKLAYDPAKDFEPVTLLGTIPLLLVVNPTLPATSVAELVAHARANPGKLSVGYGTGAAQVTAELLKSLGRIDLLAVQYRSNPLALQAVMSGEIHMMVTDPGPAIPLIEAKRVRALAVTTAERTPIAPGLPTMIEAGMAGYEMSAWYAALLPAGAPAAIRDRLHAELLRVMALPEVREKLGTAGIDVKTSSPADLGTFMEAERIRWDTYIRRAGITPE